MQRIAIAALALTAAVAAVTASAHAQPAAYKVDGHISAPDGGWDYATFDSDSRTLYIARSTGVTAVDVDSGKVTGSLTPADRGHSAVPLPGGQLLVTNGASGMAVFVEAKTGKALASVPAGKNPDGAIYDPKSGLVFVGAHSSGEVTFIDPKTQAAVASVPTGSTALEFLAVDGAGRVWANDEKVGEIIAIDIKDRKVLAHYKLDGCEGPTGLVYVPGADRLLASCDGVAPVIDPATGKIVDRLKVGEGPDAILFDPVRKRVLVPAGESGELTVISIKGSKFSVLQTVKTQAGARTGAVDPKTGKVYLPVAKMAPPASGKGRPTATPGSFELMVVSP